MVARFRGAGFGAPLPACMRARLVLAPAFARLKEAPASARRYGPKVFGADRILSTMATLLCLTLIASLRDSVARPILPRVTIEKVPESVVERPGAVEVSATDEAGGTLEGVEVRVLSIQEEQAYLAGAGRTGREGGVTLRSLPLGDTWILAEVAGRARASTHLIIGRELGRCR